MDATLPIASDAPLAPPGPDENPPWTSEAAEAPVQARLCRAPRTDGGQVVAEPLPWTMIAVTLATALLIVFGARAGGVPDSRVMTFAAADQAG